MKALLLSAALLFAACVSTQPKPAPKAANDAPASDAAPGVSQLELAAQRELQNSVERVFELQPLPKQPMLGSASAKVRVEVCSDFQCPFCARVVPTIHELAENYGELVQIVWRNCPLPFHEHALPAAEAAFEVYSQGGDKAFWAYHDSLFEHQGNLDVEGLVAQAKGIEGVNPEQVRAALGDHRHAPRIQLELQGLVDSGAASGGFGTPATFVNGRLLAGAQPYQAFETAVERALQETPEGYAQAKQASQEAYPMARARHILIQYAGAQGADAKVTRSKDEARALATELHKRIVEQHADLAQLAKEKSDCPSAPDGGELGRFTRGELVPEFENVLFAMAPGQISNVVETPFGFHIILREP
ncbi:MAG: peptidylprolyl isomerase [Myxococcales bacterium]